jgi:hypothetical protein
VMKMGARSLMMRRRLARPRRAGPARPKGAAAPAPEGPRCVSCNRPLGRLPAYLASRSTGSGGFQCEQCFYPGGRRGPQRTQVVATAQTRWLAELITGGSGEARASAPTAEVEEE